MKSYKVSSHQLNSKNNNQVLLLRLLYLKVLKLFPVAVRYRWYGWKWIEKLADFFEFDTMCSKNPQEISYA